MPFRTVFLTSRFFFLSGVVASLFIIAFIVGLSSLLPQLLFGISLATVLADILLLYRVRKGCYGYREVPDKLSNGDYNEITIHIENTYAFNVRLEVNDEIPFQFQQRDFRLTCSVRSGESRVLKYSLRPVKRGEYSFGALNIFVRSPLGFICRRFRFSKDKLVAVYPSYLQMRKYELHAISNRLMETGIKKIRRIGQNMEFELIKEYVSGDDFRSINWKATARKNSLMVNHYQDERSQQVYSIIDKGRVMQMPFHGMTLLDYAINASLVISNIAIQKFDKAGVITFQDKIGSMLPAGRTSNQMGKILETLYKQKTAFRESDFATLQYLIRTKITQRSLLLVYTNFESMYGLQRQLPYLKSLAKHHLLVIIFFENTEVSGLLLRPATNLRQIYQKGIAAQMMLDKKKMMKELQRHGIHSVLTDPAHLTVNTINKYLELKSRGLI